MQKVHTMIAYLTERDCWGDFSGIENANYIKKTSQLYLKLYCIFVPS